MTISLSLVLSACSGIEDEPEAMTDLKTEESLQEVSQDDSTFSIEWLVDSMDRGNHDLDTDVHGKLVVSKNVEPLERGDIIYYEHNQGEHIGRVVGLPGETIEIKKGQVFIDSRKLDTFYGTASVRGDGEKEYFEKTPKENYDSAAMKEYFQTSMEPVVVKDHTVFVLVDHWWRGYDSRYFGLIPNSEIKGVIVGHEKN
ncbi:signal peptidase I [Edaphobacillus lindanitolerans]|uniref:Signal peptidase I n=1 Tax=Edaphobacillus lindanitolerans TaxID=550447 RepID=A0A1U7PSF4_9BACI|nr:signal peptidase I [Edaphobacillus lindanitolerans]